MTASVADSQLLPYVWEHADSPVGSSFGHCLTGSFSKITSWSWVSHMQDGFVLISEELERQTMLERGG